MADQAKISKITLSSVFIGAAFVFFAVVYPYHLHFQEQYQLFLFDWDYIWQVLVPPGGLADLISRFFVQFFIIPTIGALIIATLLGLLQIATWRSMRICDYRLYPLSLMPPLLMWMQLCDENALLTAPIALLLSLACGIAIGTIKNDALRSAIAIIAAPLAYWALGPISIVMPLAAALPWFSTLSATAIVALCPLVAQYIFPSPLARLYCGLHYFRIPQAIPWLAWGAVLTTALLQSLRLILRRNTCDSSI